MNLLELNRRHKVGLFIAVVAAGISLLLEATTKQTAGIVLLGLACAWLLGSLRVRTLGIVASAIVTAVGLAMTIAPIYGDSQAYRGRSQDYDRAIADLRDAVVAASQPPKTLPADWFERNKPKSNAGHRVYDTTHLDEVQHACLGTLKFPHDMPSDERSKLTDELAQDSCKLVMIPASTQKWEKPDIFFGGVITGIPFRLTATNDEVFNTIQATELVPRPTFSLKGAIVAHRLIFPAGTALTLLGIASWAWVVKRRQVTAS